MNELQYRANFFVAAVPVACSRSASALVVLALVYSHTTELNGLEPVGAAVRDRDPDPDGRRDPRDHPAEHGAADRGGARREARLRADEARGLAAARQRARRADLALVDVSRASSCSASGSGGSRTASASAMRSRSSRCSLVGAVILYCFWLVLATGAFWIVHMWFLSELFEGVYQTGRWPIGVYPGLAAVLDDLPGSDRLRDHGAGGGGHVAARVDDARRRAGVRAVLFALHAAFWRFGLCVATRARPPSATRIRADSRRGS